MDFSNLLNFIDALILAIVMLLLYGGHHTPWHIAPVLVEKHGKRELHRVLAYAYGVGCILLAAWLHSETSLLMGMDGRIPFAFLVWDVGAAAVGTVAPWLIERLLDMASKAQIQDEREKGK